MKKIGIIVKTKDSNALIILREIHDWAAQEGYELYIEQDAAVKIGVKGYERNDLPSLIDIMVVLGGDGTMLGAARLAAPNGIPIFGINLGGLGFITEINRDEVFSALPMIINKKCNIEERMMLSAFIYRKNIILSEHCVLNDIVIKSQGDPHMKGAIARIFDIETFIEHNYVTTYKADGLIISTPTGSTAYNLSAGGPILYPTLRCIVITPICPHTLTNRPIVINDDQSIELRFNTDVLLTLDGQTGIALKQDDMIEIKKSRFVTKILLPCERDYFKILREKLNWGKR